MKYVFLSALIITALFVTTATAKPSAVTIYPNGATLSGQMVLTAEKNEIKLQLPNVAIPESLTISLAPQQGQKITAITYESILVGNHDHIELRNKISQLEGKITTIDDHLKSLELALSYWQKQLELPNKDVADTIKMGKTIREESMILLQNNSKLQGDKTILVQKLNEAKEQLQRKTGQNKRNWMIHVNLAIPAKKGQQFTYTYRVHHTGWKSNYSLNALPDQDLVQWLWTAKIMQQTGIDWENIDLNISTAEPVFTLTPPENAKWEIHQEATFQPRRNIKMLASPQVMLAESTVDAEPLQPTRTEGQLFAIYHLGKINIASGKETRIKIDSGTWPAEFTYLSRPLQSEQVFLQARLDLNTEFTPLPSGMSSIQVDSVHVGERLFSLHEKDDIIISFGSDPAISIDIKTNHSAGKEGLLAQKHTYDWNWHINFINNKSFPIQLRIEDSSPHAGHKDIVISGQFVPPLPNRNNGSTLSWDVTIPPQGEQQLKFGYKVKYPKDMAVHLGR